MDTLKNLFKKLALSPDATNFYLDQTIFGLFYFDRENYHILQTDKKLLHFLNLENKQNTCNIYQYLSDTSKTKIEELSKLKGQELDNQKDFSLLWEIDGDRYQTICNIYWLQSEGVVLIGLVELEKLSKNLREKYFDYVVESESEALIIFENGELVYASPTYLQMMDQKMEDIIGKGTEVVFEDIHPEDSSLIIKTFEEINKKRISKKQYRFRARKPNGDYIWREDQVTFDFDEDRGITKLSIIAKEISSQVKLDKELLRQEEIYHNLFNNIHIGLLIADKETTILEINDIACSSIGLPREVLIGARIDDPNWILFDENYEEYLLEERPVCITAATGKVVSPLKMGYYKHDEPEKVKWVELSSSPLFNESGEVDKIVCTFLDITERKTAKESLQLEKRRIDSIIDGVELGTWEWDMNKDTVDFNNHWAEMLGYTVEELSPSSFDNWGSLVHPTDLEKTKKAIANHIQDETITYDVEFRMRHKRGHWVWIASRGKIIARDTENNPVLFSGTHNDISHKKKQEEELRLFESVIKNTKDAILITEAEPYDLPGPKIIFVNEAFCKMTGYTVGELIGQTPRLLQGAKSDRKILDKVRISLENWEPCEYDLINYRKNGEEFWVNMSITPLADESGWFTHWIAVERDVTIQKKQEEELRLFESIIKNTNDAVLFTEVNKENPIDTHIAFANEAFCQLTGYDLEELIGRNPSLLHGNLTDTDTVNKIKESTRQIQAFSYELVNYKKNGEALWIDLSVTPIQNDKGIYSHWISIMRDVTQQKEQEILLREAKEEALENATRLLNLFNSMEDTVFEMDYNGTYLNIAPTKNKFIIIPPEELIGKTLHDAFPKAQADNFLSFIRGCLDENKSDTITYPLHLEDKVVWFEGRATPTTPDKVLYIATDITNRKQVENRLLESEKISLKAKEKAEESEQRFKLAANAAQLGIWDWNLNTNKIIWDDRFYEIYGLKKGEIEPDFEMWSKLVHPDDLEALLTDVDDAIKGNKQHNSNFRIICPDGKELYINGYGIIIKDVDGNPTRMIGVDRDITETKLREIEIVKAKEKAEESERRLILAAKTAQIGIWEWDILNNTIFWDDKTYEMFGRKKGQDEITYEVWYNSIHEEDRERIIEELNNAIEKNQEYKPIHRVVHPDGKVLYQQGYGHIIRNSDGKPKRLIGIVRDVTEDKLKEIELKQAKDNAEAASLAKSEFLANMSHEIRTPLNSVIGFSELLMQTQLNEAQQDYMHSVNYSANALLSLINDILDFSKIEAGKLELERERTNIYELLYQIVEMVKFKLEKKDIELLLYIAPDVPNYIFVDAVRIRQILINLMGNAVKFTKQGEIEMSLIRLKKPENSSKVVLRFEVRDTGIGISEDKQKHIFEAFSQEDTSTTRSYGGTGLGLSISNQLLALMDSTMQLKSKQGHGSTFYFDVHSDYERESLNDETLFENINNILLIDDNARSLEIIEKMLVHNNTKVETVNSGLEGLLKLQSNWQDYDVVFLDYEMPLLNGEEVVKKIREIQKLNDYQLPVFMMFDTVNKALSQKLEENYGVIDCLQKPFAKKELIESISLLRNKPEEISVVEMNISEQQSRATNFNGISLLIVDDNPMNRKVANSMLSKLFKDIEIIEAESGERAVELVKQHNLEMILMDVQMPGMSGYETTRCIREIKEVDSRLPIIALTAGTIKGERERCVAAGMNDYMSKPITLDKLKKMLMKWIDNEEWDNEISHQGLAASSKLDFNYEIFLQALGNDIETIEEILNAIREGDLEEQVIALNEAFKGQGKEKEIRAIAHTIKGVCLNLHFEKLGETAGQLQDLFPHYSGTEARLLLEQINISYQVVAEIVTKKAYLQS